MAAAGDGVSVAISHEPVKRYWTVRHHLTRAAPENPAYSQVYSRQHATTDVLSRRLRRRLSVRLGRLPVARDWKSRYRE
jgi:hypothetical protein